MSDDLRFDVRTIAHRKRRGELSQADIEKHLSGLPDDAEHGEETETQFVASWASRHHGDAGSDAE